MDDLVTYMAYEWLLVEEGVVTIGINEDGLEELSEIGKINLPSVDDEVNTEEICGEIETDSGPLNLYSPVDGQIVEINEAVIEDPNLIIEDPYGDGWLFKVEAKDAKELDEILSASTNDSD